MEHVEDYTIPFIPLLLGYRVLHNRYSSGLLNYQAGQGSRPAFQAYQAKLFGRPVGSAGACLSDVIGP
jgi:hypothetical protein